MAIPILNAISFQQILESGRTKPCILLCTNDNSTVQAEYVVKLKSGIESRENGLMAELYANQMAEYFKIPVPKPALVNIDEIFSNNILNESLSKTFNDSIGLNYGSEFLTGGFVTWPDGKAVPNSLLDMALDTFCFDALIQNPDRRTDKPNILWKGDDLFLIDHEMCFSFMYDILPQPEPWRISNSNFFQNHLFYHNFKGKDLNLDRFSGFVESLQEDDINQFDENIPNEWRTDKLIKINEYLFEVINNVNRFIDEIRRVLI